jgi:hypothetical protein
VTISLCESSVDVFVPYLGNLSALLEHAAAYARAKNIDPAILLNLRLAPNMYQVADTAAIDFVRSLPRAEINRAGDKECSPSRTARRENSPGDRYCVC